MTQPTMAMTDTDILVKTSAGTDEIRARTRQLSPRLRTVLIMADGQINAGQLRRAAATLGAPDDCLELLVRQGLVQTVPGSAAVAPQAAAVPASLAQAPSAAARAQSAAAMALAEASATRTGPERFRAAQKFMNDNAVDALGLRAFFFTLKVEKAFTAADLLALMPDFNKAMTKGSGPDVAQVLEMRARELLA